MNTYSKAIRPGTCGFTCGNKELVTKHQLPFIVRYNLKITKLLFHIKTSNWLLLYWCFGYSILKSATTCCTIEGAPSIVAYIDNICDK